MYNDVQYAAAYGPRFKQIFKANFIDPSNWISSTASSPDQKLAIFEKATFQAAEKTHKTAHWGAIHAVRDAAIKSIEESKLLYNGRLGKFPRLWIQRQRKEERMQEVELRQAREPVQRSVELEITQFIKTYASQQGIYYRRLLWVKPAYRYDRSLIYQNPRQSEQVLPHSAPAFSSRPRQDGQAASTLRRQSHGWISNAKSDATLASGLLALIFHLTVEHSLC